MENEAPPLLSLCNRVYRFFCRRMTFYNLLVLSLIAAVVYGGIYSRDEIIRRNISRHLPDMLDGFMKSEKTYIHVNTLVPLTWDKVCYSDTPNSSYLMYYRAETLVTSSVMRSKNSRLIQFSKKQCFPHDTAVLIKKGNDFYLTEKP